jgi:hypothetical protein
VIESWLKKYRNLLDYRYRIYFMDPTGKEELLKDGWRVPPLQQRALVSPKRNPSRYRPESPAYIPRLERKKAPVPVVMQKLQRQAHVEPIVAKITTPVVELSDVSKNVTPAEPIIQAEQAHVEPVSAQITTPIVELPLENPTPSVEASVEEKKPEPANVPMEPAPIPDKHVEKPVIKQNESSERKREEVQFVGMSQGEGGQIAKTYQTQSGRTFTEKKPICGRGMHVWKEDGVYEFRGYNQLVFKCKNCGLKKT